MLRMSVCLPIFLFFFIVFCMVDCMILNCSRSSITSTGKYPEPRAMRLTRDGEVMMCLGSSSSASVIESMMVIHRLIRWLDSRKSSPCIPGNEFMMLERGPIFITAWNCSRMSRSVHCPDASRFIISAPSRSTSASFMRSISPAMFPLPSSRDTNAFTSKSSKSSMCSPVPMCMIGALVAATAESAPPPFAWPSSLVMITEPTLTFSLKALAWSCAAWPIDESITNTMSSGSETAAICSISSKSAPSCLCRPDVSTMMISYPSSLNFWTPSPAMIDGSVSVYEP
mmetsp:Transcript_11743/g.30651  ORF Transcript_11743/g.30651 Transcript_11743/m.30651 type:complete len:284 (+) Transcript_11743:223-1074(+)